MEWGVDILINLKYYIDLKQLHQQFVKSWNETCSIFYYLTDIQIRMNWNLLVSVEAREIATTYSIVSCDNH